MLRITDAERAEGRDLPCRATAGAGAAAGEGKGLTQVVLKKRIEKFSPDDAESAQISVPP